MPIKKKLILRLKGGLGNQLFCYAFGLVIAKKNNYELILDTKSGFLYDTIYNRKFALNYFKLECREATYSELLYPFSRTRRFLKKYINKNKQLSEMDYIEELENFSSLKIQNISLKKNTIYLDGLWQCFSYFEHEEDFIKKKIVFDVDINDKNKDFAKWIKKNDVGIIHMRFFSSHKMSGKDQDLNFEYYSKAIKHLQLQKNIKAFAIFTDDIEKADNFLSSLGIEYKLVNWNQKKDSEIFDLWLMTQGRYLVIANSTFSWWGAWLSDYRNNGIVIYPVLNETTNNELWAKIFSNSMPKDWISI
tara:strand:- start:251 stop:1162 length:912 start_codon:yes stop_codon:yes gene_type:complete